jgi:hypothetical protein
MATLHHCHDHMNGGMRNAYNHSRMAKMLGCCASLLKTISETLTFLLQNPRSSPNAGVAIRPASAQHPRPSCATCSAWTVQPTCKPELVLGIRVIRSICATVPGWHGQSAIVAVHRRRRPTGCLSRPAGGEGSHPADRQSHPAGPWKEPGTRGAMRALLPTV